MFYTQSSFSDQGPYPENQDSIGVAIHSDWCSACVADGVGGAEHGRDAAQLATRIFTDLLEKNIDTPLYEVVTTANTEMLKTQLPGAVTTFTGIFLNELELQGVHAGDTRAYLLRGNGIKQLTEDHTEFFRLCKEGKLTPEEAENYPRKHVLENALGSNLNPRVDLFSYTLKPRDRILLTSDGAHALFTKLELRDISISNLNADDFIESITKHIKHKKLTDNFSLIAIDVG